MDKHRWQTLMELLGLPPGLDVYQALASAYREPHRHYHTTEHISECLAEFDAARDIARWPEEVELALWFHDAIYAPLSSGNERRSAGWAGTFLRQAGVPKERCQRVYDHILATSHGRDPANTDCALVIDVDLSVLGREPERFERYEQGIRREYRWVPSRFYRRKRREILRSFVDRPRIFHTEHFQARYEASARDNLTKAIVRLSS